MKGMVWSMIVSLFLQNNALGLAEGVKGYGDKKSDYVATFDSTKYKHSSDLDLAESIEEREEENSDYAASDSTKYRNDGDFFYIKNAVNGPIMKVPSDIYESCYSDSLWEYTDLDLAEKLFYKISPSGSYHPPSPIYPWEIIGEENLEPFLKEDFLVLQMYGIEANISERVILEDGSRAAKITKLEDSDPRASKYILWLTKNGYDRTKEMLKEFDLDTDRDRSDYHITVLPDYYSLGESSNVGFFKHNWVESRLLPPEWAAEYKSHGIRFVQALVDLNPELVEKYNISSTPTTIIFLNGEEVWRTTANICSGWVVLDEQIRKILNINRAQD